MLLLLLMLLLLQTLLIMPHALAAADVADAANREATKSFQHHVMRNLRILSRPASFHRPDFGA